MSAEPSTDVERLVDDALSKLTLGRTVALLTGAHYWATRADPAIGLRPVVFSDGPAGVRGQSWDERVPSVNLPTPTASAATWDEALVHRLGGALAAQARERGVDVVLAPTVNLQRSPLAGRHFEYLSEDPVLTGRIALAYVRGLQSGGVAAAAKHYVANDAETNRFTVDVRVDERTLREVYLAPFEQLVVEGGVWVVMAGYNAVNGVTMTENPLLTHPLVTEWGFDGVVVSDWYATRSTEASASGALGLVMPGPGGPWGEALTDAVLGGGVPREVVVEKARRLLRLAVRVDALAPAGGPQEREVTMDRAALRTLLRESAAASFVMVENRDETLPLSREAVARLAVLGANAAVGTTVGGGTAQVVPEYAVSPLEGLRRALGDGVDVVHAVGHGATGSLQPMAGDMAQCPHCGKPGFDVRYVDPAGRELRREHRTMGQLVWLGEDIPSGSTVELGTRFRSSASGAWEIGVIGVGATRLVLDGHTVIDETLRPTTSSFAAGFLQPPQRAVARTLREGEEVAVSMVHRVEPVEDFVKIALGVRPPHRPPHEERASAVELARTADAAVVVVGTDDRIESEGFDRTSMNLPGAQDELVRAVADVNPRTVVVVNTGGPVAMPWRKNVAAVLLTWFPGQEYGNALADVLLGNREPGGRLPTTWGDCEEDVPVLSTVPVDGRLSYTEGIHVGYRAWLRGGTSPAYPFGHGLGYTTWRYDGFDAPETTVAGKTVTAVVRLTNTGRRPGKEVVQLYASRAASAVERPEAWLAGFAAVTAEPGEQVTAELRIVARAFQHWSADPGEWQTEPGLFTLTVGRSVVAGMLTRDLHVEP